MDNEINRTFNHAPYLKPLSHAESSSFLLLNSPRELGTIFSLNNKQIGFFLQEINKELAATQL